MAVQAAHYPSNGLLLNRTGQDGHEFQLQQQSGGIFLDHQSHMFFNNNNNSNNSRKRGRQVAGEGITEQPINSFSLQNHQPSQLIELSQLHRPNVVSTGLRLSSSDQQQHKLQQNHNQNQSYQQSNSSVFLSMISDDLATQIKRQQDELDHFIQAQGEDLRRSLADKRHRHSRALLRAAEESLSRRLREKEAEVEKAKCRNVELEARATQLSMEVQVWQAKAKAHEATKALLQAQLQQVVVMSGGGGGAVAVTREEGRGGVLVEGQAEDAESGYVDPEWVVGSGGPSCKGCRANVATVVLIPCRHLCLCTECDRVAQACPHCLTVKNYSVEVFLS